MYILCGFDLKTWKLTAKMQFLYFNTIQNDLIETINFPQVFNKWHIDLKQYTVLAYQYIFILSLSFNK